MKLKKILMALSLAVATSVAFVGCGNSANDASDSSESAEKNDLSD